MAFGRLVCDIKEHKTKTHQTRLTVSRKLLGFLGLLSTTTATVITAKFLFNSVISTPGVKFLVADVKNFYLNNDLPEPKNIKLHLHIIPQEIIDKYALNNLVEKRRMGLPQDRERHVRIKTSFNHRQYGTHQTH